MQADKAFRTSIIVGVIAYLVYWFLPYTYGYLDPDIGDILSYAGYGAIYSGNNAVDILMFMVWMVSAFGMFFYRKIARGLFLFSIVASLGMTPLYGVFVETAGGAVLIDIAHIVFGMALALAYFSSVDDKFY